MKKLISIMLTIAMLLSCIAFAATTAYAAGKATVVAGGKSYSVNVGDTFNYTFNLTTPKAIESIQVIINYNDSVLQLQEGTSREMFPVLRNATTVVYNTALNDKIKFNASEGLEGGIDFTAGGVVANLNFKVIGTGNVTITPEFEILTEYNGSDYVMNGAIVNSKVKTSETFKVTSQAPVGNTTIVCDGKSQTAKVGDIVTYTFNLKTPKNLESIQAVTSYDTDILQLVEAGAADMFPVLKAATSVVYNVKPNGDIKFNATEGTDGGINFTKGGVLVTLQFKVTGEGTATVDTKIDTMTAYWGKDYVFDFDVIDSNFTTSQTVSTSSQGGNTDSKVATLICDGKTYKVNVGGKFTYTYILKTSEVIEGVQAITNYDSDVVKLVEGTAKEMFPVLRSVASVVYNANLINQVKFNAAEAVNEGFDFTKGDTLVTLNFDVVKSGTAYIYTEIDTMTKFQGGDYILSGEVFDDDFSGTEEIVITAGGDVKNEIKISDKPGVALDSVDGTPFGYIGDADKSDTITIRDATEIQKAIAKLLVLDAKASALGDTDRSGDINIKDATAVQKWLAKLEVNEKINHVLYETGTHSHEYKTITDKDGTKFDSCICGSIK